MIMIKYVFIDSSRYYILCIVLLFLYGLKEDFNGESNEGDEQKQKTKLLVMIKKCLAIAMNKIKIN